jgi:pimeloyl-ACP methyl ester carboxylesterase
MVNEQSKTPVTTEAISHRFLETNGLRMHIAEQGTGPLMLFCHGFPECWYSWRYQLPALAQAGYHVVAPDLRGYGQTEQPEDVGAYTLLHLVGDLVGILDVLGEQEAILVSHDWGSVLAWQAALMRPDRFPVLITMSAPYLPRAPLHGARATIPPTQSWRQTFGDSFFYQSWFQQPGVAEAELERDVRSSIRRLLYSLSGDAPPAERWHPVLPDPRANTLNAAGNPTSLPSWVTEADLDVYTAEFSRTGFRGGLNWYRNIDRNWELLAAYSGASILQPTLFLWGDQDPIVEIAGVRKRIERMQQFVPNLQQKELAGCGHWIQQERAQEVNAAILAFLQRL